MCVFVRNGIVSSLYFVLAMMSKQQNSYGMFKIKESLWIVDIELFYEFIGDDEVSYVSI